MPPTHLAKTRSPHRSRPSAAETRPTLESLAAVQAVLHPQFEVISRHFAVLSRRYSAHSVHQLRSAARRLRAGLRLFRNELKPTSAATLSDHLRELLAALGPARDADVWMERLRDPESAGILAAHPEWKAVLAQEQLRQRRARTLARAYLASDYCRTLCAGLEQFFLGELPPLRNTPPPPPPPTSLKRLRKQLRAIVAVKKPLQLRTADRIHEFRRECRRARYWSEYLAGAAPHGRRLQRELAAVADSLGRMRDADIAARKLARRRSWWVDRLRDRAEMQTAAAAQEFLKHWKRFRRHCAD